MHEEADAWFDDLPLVHKSYENVENVDYLIFHDEVDELFDLLNANKPCDNVIDEEIIALIKES